MHTYTVAYMYMFRHVSIMLFILPIILSENSFKISPKMIANVRNTKHKVKLITLNKHEKPSALQDVAISSSSQPFLSHVIFHIPFKPESHAEQNVIYRF